ncbi:hypothetical protein SRHO_G00269190 [Serrasalmus rhombeus]
MYLSLCPSRADLRAAPSLLTPCLTAARSTTVPELELTSDQSHRTLGQQAEGGRESDRDDLKLCPKRRNWFPLGQSIMAELKGAGGAVNPATRARSLVLTERESERLLESHALHQSNSTSSTTEELKARTETDHAACITGPISRR